MMAQPIHKDSSPTRKAQVFFWPILMTDIGSCSQWQKVCFFPNFKEKISNSRNKKKRSTYCEILSALCHSKLYFCIPNVKMCLLVNQIFDFLFNLIILYGVSFSQFCIKRHKNFPILGVGSCSQKGEKKTRAVYACLKRNSLYLALRK